MNGTFILAATKNELVEQLEYIISDSYIKRVNVDLRDSSPAGRQLYRHCKVELMHTIDAWQQQLLHNASGRHSRKVMQTFDSAESCGHHSAGVVNYTRIR